MEEGYVVCLVICIVLTQMNKIQNDVSFMAVCDLIKQFPFFP